ncbi:UvrD-helicase domain-containing protein [Candidatus Roizmanbacteria bacterium]|nr:UvrD-helicase domain-containing protein [Candidatus Roizmanbacteria bacterium]
MDLPILKHLNAAQKKAVLYTAGPSIILAGAGSGKTRVIIHKVLHYIQNNKVDPDNIVMITFTNKAANEMKERIMLATEKKIRLGYVGTFHSFCAQILRREGPQLGIEHTFTIYDDGDQTQLLKQILKNMDTRKLTPSYFSYRISAAKNQMVTPDRYLEIFSDHHSPLVAEVYEKYEAALHRNNAVDFDDLLMKTVLLFLQFPSTLSKYQKKYRYLLVDEFQDTNYAQYCLTKLLAEQDRNVTVVGDFSQSIYSWRGADIRNLEKFKEDFSTTQVFYLEVNYRSTRNILKYAYDVISKNQTHPILNLKTLNGEGEDITEHEAENEEEEALFVASEIERQIDGQPYSAFAVLYRTNAQSRVIEEAFLHRGIPYVLIGGTRFYERREIKDILSYLRLIINPTDEVALDRIKKQGKRRLAHFKEIRAKLGREFEKRTTVELMETTLQSTGYLKLYNPEDPEDYARLENIKELKSVALNFPELVGFLEQVALVESRLFYVGITRAKKKLYVTYAKHRFIFGRRGEAQRSRFLAGEEVERFSY